LFAEFLLVPDASGSNVVSDSTLPSVFDGRKRDERRLRYSRVAAGLCYKRHDIFIRMQLRAVPPSKLS